MDVDVEVDDLDFEPDRIKNFLLHKLEEIQISNAKVKDVILERRKVLEDTISKQNLKMDDISVRISLGWKKLYNNKYVIGYEIINEDHRPLQDFNFLLRWNSSSDLNYVAEIYKEVQGKLDVTKQNFICNDSDCKKRTNMIEKAKTVEAKGYLVIVIDFPDFANQLLCEIQGNLVCKRGDEHVNIEIGNVKISSVDATDRMLYDWPLSQGNVENLFTVISSCEQVDLLLLLPKGWNTSLNSTFEIHCSLTLVDVPNCCRRYFFAQRVSAIFDGSLVEIHAPTQENPDMLFMTVYTKNEDQLFPLLHHIHQNIPDAIIIPKNLYQHYLINSEDKDLSMTRDIQKFKHYMDEEIRHVQNFFLEYDGGKEVDKDIVAKFKVDLACLENNTDLLYLKICGTE